MINEFSHHAIPLPFVVLSSIFTIRHQFYFIREAQNIGELFQQVQAVSLKAIISIQWFIRFLIHDIWIFLKHTQYTAMQTLLVLPRVLPRVIADILTRIVVTMRVLLAIESVTFVDESLLLSVKLRPVWEFHTPIYKDKICR